ncbi:MAG: hypothetical protein NC078_12580 [Ruminococcus sp.]|nr:hypothetical protein [Ruminococcus sp.]
MTQFDIVHEVVELVRKRPGMYFGSWSVRAFKVFLDGYFTALEKYRPIEFEEEKFAEDTPLPFWYFHEFAVRKFGYRESTAGWANIIADSVGDGSAESWGKFLDVYDEFRAMRIVGCEKAELTAENISHGENFPMILISKRADGSFGEQRLFYRPTTVYLLKITGGYELILCECDEYIREIRELFAEGKGAERIKEYFGNVGEMKECSAGDIPREKKIL